MYRTISVNVDVDIDDVITQCRDELIEELSHDAKFNFISELHRIHDLFGEQAVVDKLKDYYHEYKLYIP